MPRLRGTLASSCSRPRCRSRETPLPNTAATPTLDPPVGRRAPLGPSTADRTPITTRRAIARPPTAAAGGRRSTRRPVCAPTGARTPSAGAWTASWIAADRSPQKSSALGGGSSASSDEARGPKGTSSSRGPSQSRGRRTTLVRRRASCSPASVCRRSVTPLATFSSGFFLDGCHTVLNARYYNPDLVPIGLN